MKKSRLLVGLIVLLFLFSCKDEENPVVSVDLETGIVTGQVLSLNGAEEIQGALVTVQNLQNSPQAYTDINGFYSIANVPIGSQTLFVQKGLFESLIQVSVSPNTTISAPQVNLQATGKLGFVYGAYDNIQHIIREKLGYAVDSLTIDDLGNAAKLAEYKAIFLNCGFDVSLIYYENTEILDVMKSYIQNGGNVYASDWAGEFVEYMFPESLTVETTGPSQMVVAKIIDQDLKNFIGSESISINYDLSGWAEVITLGQSVTTLISGDYLNNNGAQVSNKPLAVSFIYGSGKVLYTSFHNETNVTSDVVQVLIGFLYNM